ncbi:beta-glucoside-specific PTS transporter subunit IIABC [uncultured Microbacterium sp.]|uniref:beta-glucoside-specific PTS transporter subunit IIABC n=1 Tax=uncultured Microbacterium sp. TaxID=191216 RepID=UPI0025E3CB5B|nr:beta-glucoside-specific PTS transporter subunit IIABC [uncultured Microbacterium sp.]
MSKVKKDYGAIYTDIVAVCGGAANIATVTHCMTRLRVQLVDPSKLDKTQAKSIPGVLSFIQQDGEDQFAIGQDVPELYEEFVRRGISSGGGHAADVATRAGKWRPKNVVNAVFSFIGGTFSPIIPVLVAGGLTGAVLTLLTTFFGVATDSGTYQVFYFLNQAAFYFLPVFIGFSAANRLKSNPYLGAFLGGVLIFFTINAGDEPMTFAGIDVPTVAYNSTVFPVILGVLFMSVVYRFLQKYMPVVLRTIFVPLLTMLITVPVTLIVLGPIGNEVGTWLADGVLALYNVSPPIAVAIIGLGTPWLVFFGMNNAMYPIVFALLAQVGSDPLIMTGMAAANVAVGGACLAVALVAKRVEEKSLAGGAGVTALCGITEPGVYGILFVKRYPLIGAMVGGAIGGLIAGLVGMTQYVISTPGFISFAAYINPDGTPENFIWAMVVMVLSTVIAFGVTYFLGRKREKVVGSAGADPAAQDVVASDAHVLSPMTGTTVALSTLRDEVFASGALGEGVAIVPAEGKAVSPVSGEVVALFPTGHAIGIRADGGAELLIHIGLDTVKAGGEYFTAHVEKGQRVSAGDVLVDFDLDGLLKAGYDLTTPVVVTNAEDFDVVLSDASHEVVAGTELYLAHAASQRPVAGRS